MHVSRKAFELVNSPENHEKLGGILAINELIDVPVKENETKMIRFANYLRGVFPSPTADADTLKLASKALGACLVAVTAAGTVRSHRRGAVSMGRVARSATTQGRVHHPPPVQWLLAIALLSKHDLLKCSWVNVAGRCTSGCPAP